MQKINKYIYCIKNTDEKLFPVWSLTAAVHIQTQCSCWSFGISSIKQVVWVDKTVSEDEKCTFEK